MLVTKIMIHYKAIFITKFSEIYLRDKELNKKMLKSFFYRFNFI